MEHGQFIVSQAWFMTSRRAWAACRVRRCQKFAEHQLSLQAVAIFRHVRSLGNTAVAGHAKALGLILTKPRLCAFDLSQVHLQLGLASAGQLRTRPVQVGRRVIFPSPELVPQAMEQYLFALHILMARSDWHVCDKAAWVAYHLVRIHPFADGNGRMSRLLANWVLFCSGVPFTLVIGAGAERSGYLRSLCEGDTLPEEESHRPLGAFLRKALQAAWAEANSFRMSCCIICLQACTLPPIPSSTTCCNSRYHGACLQQWLQTQVGALVSTVPC
ncbi:unnamed protein product [Polarella glacialis]|uniref:Fido domain-containing protein n=1 Tax=Polarella glacialis TaxID=89957 RepID=A0A813FU02_POLGL|nr:unnamed protein product [Polarella glacialis]